MSKLSFGQIEALWIVNGGAPAWAPTMAGVAMAESGGNTTSLNNTPATGDYSVGLFQINYFGSMLPGRTKDYGSPAALSADPNLQAKAAISLLGGGKGISNWMGDKVGNFAQNGVPLSLASAQSLVGQMGISTADALDPNNLAADAQKVFSTIGLGAPPASTAAAATGAATATTTGWEQWVPGLGPLLAGLTASEAFFTEGVKVITDLTKPGLWVRIGEFLLGLNLVFWGLVLFVSTSKPGQQAISTGEKAGPLLAMAAA